MELIVAVVSAVIAVLSAGLSIWGQMRVAQFAAEREQQREEKSKKEQAEAVLSRYREPLLHAAFELQSRAFNLLRMDLMGKLYVNGTEAEKKYVVDNTTYVIAQYLGWSEIIRRDMQFLDLGSLDKTRNLSKLQDDITNVFLNRDLGPVLRVFRGDQRAIGESMIVDGAKGSQCMGYATFRKNRDADFLSWFTDLREQIKSLAGDLASGEERLTNLQHALIDLLDYLDPDCARFPAERRKKV